MTTKNSLSGSDLKGAFEWRCIGPYRAGRVVAVAGDPVNTGVFYFGAVAGGVWKSTDGGTYWHNISDGYFNTSSVGAIAVAQSDPNVIYTGMGEACIRVDVTYGDGVYRSIDAGKTWTHLGLENTRHISRIRIHPNNPDLVYVAAFGHAFGPNEQRGIFRSKNGGRTWENILHKSDIAGAADLSMDPHNPRILYASIWQAQRSFWSMDSGGPDCGLYRSTDGGDSWQEITRQTGLPQGTIGRIGVSVSPAKTGLIWALIEAEDGGIFRSDDGGDSWKMLNDSEDVRSRPWYYTHIFADPKNSETVYVLAPGMLRSTDGGKTFSKINMAHSDQHDLWIDPDDPQRMIEGNDGGAYVSYNGGETWSSGFNQPTSQLYSAVTDNQFPYRVYGAQQDNSAISVPSRSVKGFITWDDCYTIGLSESGKVAVNPSDPSIVYSSYPGGTLMRYDHKNSQVRVIMVWPEYYQNSPPKEYKYRFGWEFPISISPHDPNILYTAGNLAFKSTDEGTTWEPISGDLTRDDPNKQELSGPITSEGPWAEIYCTIYSFAESPSKPGLLWAGTDDGLIHISLDGGGKWTNVTPHDLPEWTMISTIEPSIHDPAKAYVAATRYKLDDDRPMIYKTTDYGATWELIVSGIKDGDFTRVVREDPEQAGLIYAGTETGVYFSTDDGYHWQPIQLNLPIVPIYDISVKDSDLIVATHGRSFWILDDISPLQQSSALALTGDTRLFKPRTTIRMMKQAGSIVETGSGNHYTSDLLGAPAAWLENRTVDGKPTKSGLTSGMNPPDGVAIDFILENNKKEDLVIEILDSNKNVIRQLFPVPKDAYPVKIRNGLNRIYWDLMYNTSFELPDEAGDESPFAAKTMAPLAAPGTYSVRLKIGDTVHSDSFQILKDPRSATSQKGFDKQLDLQLQIRDKYEETRDLILQIRSVKQQVSEWEKRYIDSHPLIANTANSILRQLSEVENEIVPYKSAGPQPRGIPVGLYAKIKELMGIVSCADWPPTKSSYELLDDLSDRLEIQFAILQNVINQEVPALIKLLDEENVPLVST